MAHSEEERLKNVRVLIFENGCECIASGKIALQPPDMKDEDAVAYYEANCICTRSDP